MTDDDDSHGADIDVVSDDGIWKATLNCKNPTKVAESHWQKECKK
jgi:hypothetical protein